MLNKIFQTNSQENNIINSLRFWLQNPDHSENFFIVPKYKIPTIDSYIEIDLLLFHPVLGIYVIDINKSNTLLGVPSDTDLFDKITSYKNHLNDHLKNKLKISFDEELPINIEARLFFPNIENHEGILFFGKNSSLRIFKKICFFKEDISTSNKNREFFESNSHKTPNSDQLSKIIPILIDKKLLGNNKEIKPIITSNEIVYYDEKQFKVLDNYKEDFKVIRGVAGTGKTIILTKFIQNNIKKNHDNQFLILAYNRKLLSDIEDHLQDFSENTHIHSLHGFLRTIDFINESSLDGYNFEDFDKEICSSEHNDIFRKCVRTYLSSNPINYMVCDETQDMPANLMRILYEEINNCVFFIDEAQRFYENGLSGIADIFHHPDFAKIDMRGRVQHLNNVYRTPSKIATTAFKILEKDIALNKYYTGWHYIKNSFTDDINMVLDGGSVQTGDFQKYSAIIDLIKENPNRNIKIVTQYKKKRDGLENYITKLDLQNKVQVFTAQSCKGLEADIVILHDFPSFLEIVNEKTPELLYRKCYVLLTRAKEKLYISTTRLEDNSESVRKILDFLEQESRDCARPKSQDSNMNLEDIPTIQSTSFRAPEIANLMPKAKAAKVIGGVVLTGFEIFSWIFG